MRYTVTVERAAPAIQAAAASAVDAEQPKPPCIAGPGFASIRWHGEEFSFGGRLQRAVIACLWSAWQEGTPDVPEAVILREIDSDSAELRLLFRGHPCWGKLIQRSSLHGGPVGCYRLA